MLHLTKVGYGAQSLEEVLGWFANREPEYHHITRYKPKRAEEIAGQGSLFWIVKHRLVARTPILRFEEAEGGRCAIVLDTRMVPVIPQPKRAHQGWRYLEARDAPPDAFGGDLGEFPPELAGELRALGLV